MKLAVLSYELFCYQLHIVYLFPMVIVIKLCPQYNNRHYHFLACSEVH